MRTAPGPRWGTAGAGLLLALAVVTPAPASTFPTLLGHTSVEGEGNVGITVLVPRLIDWDDVVVSFELRGATFGVAMVVLDPSSCPHELWCEGGVPLEYAALASSGPHAWPGGSGLPTSGEMNPGLTGIYLLSDGWARLTIETPLLGGSAELIATGSVDGALEHLERRCPVGDCANIAYGGAARDQGSGPAIAGVAAWTGYLPAPKQSLGITSVDTCIYSDAWPDSPPADPAAHPFGCDNMPTADDPDDLGFVTSYCCGTAIRQWEAHTGTQSSTYVGYSVSTPTSLGDGFSGAVAFWLRPGIDCPSGNHFDCEAPS